MHNGLRSKLERFAVPELSKAATVMFIAGYLLLSLPFGARLYNNFLAFYPREVLHGQIWRIVTALMYPPVAGQNIFWAALGIFIYYNFASAVEQMMGNYEFNLYFFGSFLIGEIGTVIFYLISKTNAPYIPLYTQFAVFMAFAIMNPQARVLLFFVIPVKIWYVAAFEVVVYIWHFIAGDSLGMFYGILYTRISIISAFIPILVFYNSISRNSGSGNLLTDLRLLKNRIKSDMIQRKRRREWQDVWRD